MTDVRFLIMDVDGTLTDGRLYLGGEGELFKAFDAKDGYAIQQILPSHNVIPVVVTGRSSAIVSRRCLELGISEVYQDCVDKKAAILALGEKYSIPFLSNGKLSGTAYIGDDLLDIPGMEMSEIVGCPADATSEVLQIADFICKKPGGYGAVREFIEWLTSTSSS